MAQEKTQKQEAKKGEKCSHIRVDRTCFIFDIGRLRNSSPRTLIAVPVLIDGTPKLVANKNELAHKSESSIFQGFH